MNNAEFQLQGLSDPRLAVHATSALPAWLWSSDGTRVLWSNPVGARAFGAANSTALAREVIRLLYERTLSRRVDAAGELIGLLLKKERA